MMPAALEARKPKVSVKKDRNMDQNQNHTFDKFINEMSASVPTTENILIVENFNKCIS